MHQFTSNGALAKDLLWRRETRNECSDRPYDPPTSPGLNHVIVESITNLVDVETVLYSRIGANIENPTPEHLADLAICSVRKRAGAQRKDGITYLMSVKEQGIETFLMRAYEDAVLQKTNADSLQEAYDRIRSGIV